MTNDINNDDKMSRKWQITINNPEEYGFTREWIKNIFGVLKSLTYWCMADEIGEEGTKHVHIYMAFKSGVRFSTLKKKFNEAHIEMCRGTSQQNREYVFKLGKWEKDKKGETNLKETQEEGGELPIERPGARNDLADMLDMVKNGDDILNIIDDNPNMMFNVDKLAGLQQRYVTHKYKSQYRMLETTYVYGATGLGKSRGIIEKHGLENVYRISDYSHPFDTYNSQDVLVFEEFDSSVRMAAMLQYIDIYPIDLPARFYQKTACYTKVYIVSNLPLEEQYKNVQKEKPDLWSAFLRRIHFVKHYTPFGIVEQELTKDYFKVYNISDNQLPIS